jgi:hypothetical protein
MSRNSNNETSQSLNIGKMDLLRHDATGALIHIVVMAHGSADTTGTVTTGSKGCGFAGPTIHQGPFGVEISLPHHSPKSIRKQPVKGAGTITYPNDGPATEFYSGAFATDFN